MPLVVLLVINIERPIEIKALLLLLLLDLIFINKLLSRLNSNNIFINFSTRSNI